MRAASVGEQESGRGPRRVVVPTVWKWDWVHQAAGAGAGRTDAEADSCRKRPKSSSIRLQRRNKWRRGRPCVSPVRYERCHDGTNLMDNIRW